MSSQEYEPADYDDTYYFDDGRPICWRPKLHRFLFHWDMYKILMVIIVVAIFMYLYYNYQTLFPQVFKGGSNLNFLNNFHLIEIE